jgi:Zn-dependent protease
MQPEDQQQTPPRYPGAEYYQQLAERGAPQQVTPKYNEKQAQAPVPFLTPVQPLPRDQQMRTHNPFTRFIVRWGGTQRLLIMLGTAALSVVVYYFLWEQSWLFAFGLVGLLFVHEMGHAFALRIKKLPATFPIFIPGMGAFVTLPNQPISMRDDAEISLAGPFLGGVGSLVALAIFVVTLNFIWLDLAYFSFFINLLNLIPVLPLDGGHIGRVLSPLLGVLGLVLLAALYFVPGSPFQGSIFILLIGFLGINEVMRGFNTPVRQMVMRQADRITVAVMYGGLAVLLGLGFWATDNNNFIVMILRWRLGL